jgi:hypothetical protein
MLLLLLLFLLLLLLLLHMRSLIFGLFSAGARVCMDIVMQYFIAPVLCLACIGPLVDYFLEDYLKFNGPWPDSWDDELVALRLPFLSKMVRGVQQRCAVAVCSNGV